MHIPYKPQILLVTRRLTYRLPPFFYQLEDSVLYARRVYWRAFGEATDKLVEKLFRADLKVKGVSAVLNANIKEL